MPFVFDTDELRRKKEEEKKRRYTKQTSAPESLPNPAPQPVNEQPSKTVTAGGDMLGQIYNVSITDKEKASAMYAMYNYYKTSDPSSPVYAPYSKPTNKAVNNLAAMGIDTSNVDDAFFEKNKWLQDYYTYSNTTNSPVSPGKKASQEQKAAYEYYQLWKNKDFTDQVDQEWASMKDEIAYWVGRDDLNLSDDEIFEKLKKKMPSEYKALYQLDTNKDPEHILELNRGTDYSDDAIYGAIWSARNPDVEGNSDYFVAMNALGRGNKWVKNDETYAKRSRNSDDYSRYSVGMTADEVGLYYHKSRFSNEEVEEIGRNTNFNDDKEAAAWKELYEANENTKAAEEELTNLNAWIDDKVNRGWSAEKITGKLDALLAKSDYSTLRKMDKTLNSKGELMKTTREIDYSRKDIERSIADRVDAHGTKKSGDDTLVSLENPQVEPANVAEPSEPAQTVQPKAAAEPAQPSATAQPEQTTETEPTAETEQAEPEQPKETAEPSNIAEPETGAFTPSPAKNAKANLNTEPVKSSFDKNSKSQTLMKPEYKAKTGIQLIEEVQNDKFSTSSALLHEKLTEKERQVFGAFPGVQGQRLIDGFTNVKNGKLAGPIDNKKLTDPEWLSQMSTAQARKADNDYMSAAFGSMALRSEYEDIQGKADELRSQLEEIDKQYGTRLLAEKEIPQEVVIDLGDYSNTTLRYEMDEEGHYHLPAGFYDNWIVSEYMAENGLTQEQFSAVMDEKIKSLDAYADSIRKAKEEAVDADTSYHTVAMPDEEQYASMQSTLQNYEDYLAKNYDAYNQAKAELQEAMDHRDNTNAKSQRDSGQAIDPTISDAVIDYVAGFGSYQPAEPEYDSLIDKLRNTFGIRTFTEEDAAYIEWMASDIDEDIADIKYVLENYDNIPQDYRDKMTANLNELETEKRLIGDFMITKEDNYQELVNKGKGLYWQNVNEAHESTNGYSMTGVNKTGWGQMTSTEQDVYYALYAQQGQEAADRFYQDIEPSLIQRTKENIQEGARETAQSGWLGRVFAETVGVGLAGIEVGGNVLYLLGSLLHGEGDPWLRIPSYAAKTAHQEVTQELHNVYKGNALDTIFSGLAEIYFNRGRSYVVGGLFGDLFPEGTSEVFQAMPIATVAMGDAYEEAIGKNAEPWQAWTLACVNFLAESATEGIELNHIKEALQPGLLTRDAFKGFFLSRVPNAIQEAVGEDLNNIIERSFDTWIMGDKSERAEKIRQYTDAGYSEEDAEYMVMMDAVKDDIHTALISVISSYLDIGFFVAGKIKTTIDYAKEVQQYRRAGDAKTTIRDLRTRDMKIRQSMSEAMERAEQASKNGEQPAAPETTTANEEAVQGEPAQPVPSATNPAVTKSNQSDEYDVDLTILENSQDSDTTTVTSTVASVLQVNDQNANQAAASATAIENVFGGNPIKAVSDLLYGGVVSDVNIGSLKMGIQYAALVDGACRQVVQSEEYQNATPDMKAQMLAQATMTDATNDNAVKQAAAAVHEFRVAMEEQRLMADGAAQVAEDAQQRADDALLKSQRADEALETQQNVEGAAAEQVQKATEAVQNEPTDENVKQVTHAVTQLENQSKVTQEYEQSAQNAKKGVQSTQEEADRVSGDTMANIRQQAEANVAQVEQAEAQALAEQQAKLEEQARIAAEEQAKLQAEEDQRSGKAEEDRVDALIDDLLNQQHLEGEEREKQREALTQRAEQIRLGKIDMNGLMSNTEGYLAVSAFGRKLGLNFQLSDSLPNGTRGMYQNGTVYLNNDLIKNGKMTIGQALVEASLHEITHAMENTKSYQKYRQVVLDALFTDADGNFDQAAYDAAIDQKIEDYKAGVNQDLKPEDAEKEIIADFARTKLNGKEVVQRFMDAGLGGKMRNALHNINQAIKNFKLTGQEKTTAEYLRRAERSFQKALNEVAETAVHPEGNQFSLQQFAQAAKMSLNEDTLELYDADGNLVDGVNNKVTADMINNTPVGMLIDLAQNGAYTKKGDEKFAPTITPETAQAQKQMFADLMNMVAQYKDSNLVWEIASSTMFSALKSNSDPQYSTTVDFGTVCAKTQEIINVLSEVMLKEGRGLTRQEVLDVYNATAQAGLTVPCPVCYVFSRWMGVPSLLNQMSEYQKRFVATNEDGTINTKETQKLADKYVKDALTKYGNKEGIDKAKVSLTNRIKTQETNRVNALTVMNSETATEEEKAAAKTKHDEAMKNLDALTKDLGEVEAYNWVTQALLNKNGKVDKDFELTPDDVLFDLRRTGDFAKYTKNWKYRNTRGAGMGKAIMPYSGETIGDIIYGTTRKTEIKNPLLMQRPATAANGIKNAIKRARQQNLIGGQRLQSTSDFRPEWGLDYMMSFLELQAVGSKVQMYTKVAEAVDLLASMGADVNLSIMGQGQGWHIDENGQKVLDFSDVTGMDFKTALELKNKYDNVQMILVGMNDDHIRLAIANSDIDFVIPWHSSGNSKDALASMLKSLDQNLETSSDYTDTQADAVSKNQTPEQKKLWDLRMKILQGKTISQEERNTIYHDDYLRGLYDRFNVKGEDADCFGVKLGADQAKQIFPYEYWNKGLTKDQADGNGKAFIDYCNHFGIVPRFSGVVKHNDDGTFSVTGNFAGAIYDDKGNITGYDESQMDTGYWKLLIDRPMYDNKGNYRDQQVVDVTKAKIGHLENGELVDSDMPLKTSAMYGPNYSEQEKNAVDNARSAIADRARMNGGQYSVYGDEFTTADMEQMVSQANTDYMDAVNRGDMEAAENDVEFAAEANGYTDKAYHGTTRFGFTEFDMSKKASGGTIFVAYDQSGASTYSPVNEIRNISDADLDNLPDERLAEMATEYLHEENPESLSREELIEKIKDFRDRAGKTDRRVRTEEQEKAISGIYQLYTKPGKQLVVDAKGKNWDKIFFGPLYRDEVLFQRKAISEGNYYTPRSNFSTRLIAQWAKENGYDSVRINNVADNGGYTEQNGRTFEMTMDIGVFFNANDVKSADTVTRDNNGNVIPLDQRFSDNPDIRYSYGNDMTEADMDQALIDAGVTTQEEIAMASNLPGQPLDEGSAQRQFGHQTSQTSNALHQQVKDYLYTHSDYTPDTNQDQINRAVSWVQSLANEYDPDGYRDAMNEVTSDNFDYRSADGQAKMLTVMGMAALKADKGDQNALADELRLADAYNKQGTDLGRQLQARKLFRLMTPVGRRMSLQQEVARINQEYKNANKDTTVSLSEMTLLAAENAQTEEDFQKVQRAAEQELASQMPATWKEKLRTWRMLSMLANPRTHIRNILGNSIFVPVVDLKNAIGQGLESMFVKEGEEKTKSIKHTAESEAFADEDVIKMRDTLTGEAKYSPEGRINQEKKAFGQGNGILSRTIGQGAQLAADFNSDMLEKEDWVFLNRHYRNALAGYMTANNLTAKDMTGKTLEKARAYAIQEAQKATYRDANSLSSWLNQASREGGLKGFAVDAILSFKKTPANILRRGIEYSPIGLFKSFATAKKSIDLYKAWESNGMKGDMPKGAKSLTQVLDGIASGLSGTAVSALGALAYALGAVKLGFGSDDDDELKKERGSQEYSVELFGYSFTIDWAAPVCMPFFTGAALYKRMTDQDSKFSVAALVDTLTKISEPVFNLSMLDGVNTLLKTLSYSNGNEIPIGELAQKVGANYLGSYVPSMLGAVARTVDTTRRKNYVESGADLPIWRNLLEQVENKIPFLSARNVPYRDVWGEAEESSRFEAFMENFLLPGYINKMKDDKVVEELQRLYDRGEDSVIPKAAGKKLGDEKLNAERYDQYAATRGTTAKALLSELIETPEFIALTKENPEAQAQLVKDVWEYTNAVARHELQPDYKLPGWVAEAYASGDVINSIFSREETKAKDAYAEKSKTDLFTSIDKQDAEGISASVQGMKDAGKTEKSIRTTLMRHYGDLYKKAYLADDDDTMDAIKYGLMYANLGDYDIDDDVFEKWEKDADKKAEEAEDEEDNNSSSARRSGLIASTGMSDVRYSDGGGTAGAKDTTGQYGMGNIDLNNRQVVQNDDGTISTEQSFSFYDEDTGKEVLIPTVIDGQIVSEQEAIDHYYETGEYLGMFDTPEEADEYAEKLHNRQDWYYNR